MLENQEKQPEQFIMAGKWWGKTPKQNRFKFLMQLLENLQTCLEKVPQEMNNDQPTQSTKVKNFFLIFYIFFLKLKEKKMKGGPFWLKCYQNHHVLRYLMNFFDKETDMLLKNKKVEQNENNSQSESKAIPITSTLAVLMSHDWEFRSTLLVEKALKIIERASYFYILGSNDHVFEMEKGENPLAHLNVEKRRRFAFYLPRLVLLLMQRLLRNLGFIFEHQYSLNGQYDRHFPGQVHFFQFICNFFHNDLVYFQQASLFIKVNKEKKKIKK